jgi:hypothetical protein
MDNRSLSPLARFVLHEFSRQAPLNHERKITVNPVVSKFATWYEKLRNAMEYREDEVILRATIQRILNRRLLLGGNGKTTAEPLVKELLWARYLPENSMPESIIERIEEIINLYLDLRFKVLQHHRIPDATINEWIFHLTSSHIERLVNPNHEKETISNFMFQVLKEQVQIVDEDEETRNAQVFLAVRKSFARDDLAFLRYHLFAQYFGELNRENVDHIAREFRTFHNEVQRQLTYPMKDRILNYVKKRTPAFLILEDVLRTHKEDIHQIVSHQPQLEKTITLACEKRYANIKSKVRMAIVRSVIFILLTKVMFAFLVEGTYERIVYGEILWTSIIINTTIPPLLMIIVSMFIRTPGSDNTKRIISYIETLLYDPTPRLGNNLSTYKKVKKSPLQDVFNVLWLFAFMLSFGGMIFILSQLRFNIVSQGIFIFFFAIVSFLSYRISLAAGQYSVGERQGLITPVVDFLFMPVVRVGRRLTLEISKFNFLLFIVDFFIETPFKVIFGFFDQWFYYLHAKREEIE